MSVNLNFKKSTFENFVDLSSSIDKEDFPTDKINRLVLECKNNFSNEKFENLLVVIFSVYDIKYKIIETAQTGNFNYLSNDDYFSLYSEILWNCVRNYTEEVGDFKNFFIMFFRTQFLDAKKNSFLKVTGNIKKEKRKNIKIINIEGFTGSAGIVYDLDEKVSALDVHNYLTELTSEQRSIIEYMWFSGDKKKSVKDTAIRFNLTENQVNYRLKIAFETIRSNHPNALNDFMSNSQSEKIIEFPNASAFRNNDKTGYDDVA